MANNACSVRVPKETVNDETVKLIRWAYKDASKVKKGAVLAEVETSKSVLEILAPETGHVRHCVKEGGVVAVGGLLCWITSGATDILPKEEDARVSNTAAARFSEKARVLMEKHGLSIEQFSGKGLVRENDVRALLEKDVDARAKGENIERRPLPERKCIENRYLSADGNNRFSSSVTVLCPTKGLRVVAKKRADMGASLTPAILFECARVLREFPILNAYYEEGQACVYRDVHVGWVIDDGRGIRVPVVQNADKKELSAIAREVQDRALEYHEDALPVEALQGGTFTVTDLSGEDVFSFRPLINKGQAAILGIGAEFYSPGQDAGVFQLNLTFDHRLTEGREAARFLRALRERLAAYEESA